MVDLMSLDPNAALGVLPMDTLNHFAKDVGIPLNLEAAVSNVRCIWTERKRWNTSHPSCLSGIIDTKPLA